MTSKLLCTFSPPQARWATCSASVSRLFIFCLFILNDLCQTNYHRITTGPIFAKFSEFVELWLEMNNLKLVFRSLNGRCHGNEFLSVLSTELIRWTQAASVLTLGFALHLVFLMLPIMLTCRCTSQLPARRCASVGTDCGRVSVCVSMCSCPSVGRLEEIEF